ncbi:MAG: hypothetical protein OXI94_01810, partial [Gemmatimonadota bacterium]|nr:hypothetical protein [Gemmatimonadota bacterium]
FGMRTGNWKLIYEEGQTPEETELFHIGSDPYETANITSTQLDRVHRMLEQIADERKRDNSSIRN